MTRTITEDTRWVTYDDRVIPLKDLEDIHLANLIKWVKEHPLDYPVQLLQVLHEIAEKRGLTEEFLAGAEYPYKDRDGNLTLDMKPLSPN